MLNNPSINGLLASAPPPGGPSQAPQAPLGPPPPGMGHPGMGGTPPPPGDPIMQAMMKIQQILGDLKGVLQLLQVAGTPPMGEM